jgi:outer membrane murein-binding lipoprotein Lpp
MQEPKFTESRPVMFKRFYQVRFLSLARTLFVRGRHGTTGGWGGGATRTKVRELARKMARDDMKKFRQAVVLLAVILVSVAGFAQTAKVIQLNPDDAGRARDLYAEQKRIEQDIADLQKKIKKEYLTKSKKSDWTGGSVCYGDTGQIAPGWGCGEFEFSDDYKFIVPPQAKSQTTWSGVWNGCTYTVPSTSSPSTLTPGTITFQ